MTWFAAHELFTPLHHIRAHAEALLAGAHGPLPLAAMEPVVGIAEAARSLERALRALAEIEALRRRPRARTPLRPVALRAILGPGGSAGAGHAPAVYGLSAELLGPALAVLLADAEEAGSVRLHVGRRRVAVELRGDAAGPDAGGEGAIRRELALLQLTAAGARLRRGRGRLLVLWRRAPDPPGVRPEHGGDAANRVRA